MRSQTDISDTLYDLPILIVEDDSVSSFFIEKVLSRRGFTRVHVVESAEKAMEHIARKVPALVILDIYMPGMNGLDFCIWIRGQRALQELPVLMLTAAEDEALRYKAFKAGANDFISKPLQPEELFARAQVQLQNQQSLKRLQHYKMRLDSELQNARAFQLSILPDDECRANIQEHCKLEVASYIKTSSEIGGDFWGMKNLFNGQAALWAADLSGHGVAAALNAFHLQAHMKEHSPLAGQPGQYMSHLNEKLLQFLLRGHFATMFYGVIDRGASKLHYACACCPHPLIVRNDGSVEKLDGSGTPLGVCMQCYTTQSIDFHPGDMLVLYSDALIETQDASGKYISIDDIMTQLKCHKGKTAHAVKEAMQIYFSHHSSAPLADDLTICVCRRME